MLNHLLELFADENKPRGILRGTPSDESRVGLQIDLSPSSGGVSQYYCGFVRFSEGSFFSVICIQKYFLSSEKFNFENRHLRVES